MKSILWGVPFVLLLASGCREPEPRTESATPRRGPTVRATVVTIQTTVFPADRTTTHEVVIAGAKARTMDESHRWRLFDTYDRTVTFVNDIEKTYRREPVEDVFASRRAALRRPVDRPLPAAQFQATGVQREILGLPATQALIRLGGYQRQLWFAKHPKIPEDLFAMIHGTAEPATRLGAIVAVADQGLLAMRGFPLLDQAEMPYGNARMAVDRRVTKIEERDVPASLIDIPDNYRESQ